MGVRIDRIQLPLSRDMGFRHPTLGLVLANWDDENGHETSQIITHEFLDGLTSHGSQGTPYEGILLRGETHLLVTDIAEGGSLQANIARFDQRNTRRDPPKIRPSSG